MGSSEHPHVQGQKSIHKCCINDNYLGIFYKEPGSRFSKFCDIIDFCPKYATLLLCVEAAIDSM